jgi:hypothetical protein
MSERRGVIAVPKPLKYRRVLLKLSGEALMGADTYGVNRAATERMAQELKSAVESNVQRWSSAAEISFAEWHRRRTGWIVPPPTTSVCSRPS